MVRVQEALRALLNATTSEQVSAAAEAARISLKRLQRNPLPPPLPEPSPAPESQRELLARNGSVLRTISNEQLSDFNLLLPWSAVTPDEDGRNVGRPWANHKRSTVSPLPEKRHRLFDAVLPLAGRHVLEVGCFEGIHTLSLIDFGARVTAVDARMENILKTLCRLWIYGRTADVVLWNLELAAPATAPDAWDVLHHIGVLYHLTDPVGHLNTLLARTREAVLLDTHIAQDVASTDGVYASGERYFTFSERPTSGPFAGMEDHAKWLVLEDLVELLRRNGFGRVEVVNDRQERNGRRICLFAFRA